MKSTAALNQASRAMLAPAIKGHRATRVPPGVAFLMSAVLPGSGQAAQGRNRAFAYLGIEAISWIAHVSWTDAGNKKEGEYEAYANRHWILATWDSLAAESNPDCQAIPPGVSYADSKTTIEGFLETGNYQHYYEDIGKLEAYRAGWDDFSCDEPDVMSPNRVYYRGMRRIATTTWTRRERLGRDLPQPCGFRGRRVPDREGSADEAPGWRGYEGQGRRLHGTAEAQPALQSSMVRIVAMALRAGSRAGPRIARFTHPLRWGRGALMLSVLVAHPGLADEGPGVSRSWVSPFLLPGLGHQALGYKGRAKAYGRRRLHLDRIRHVSRPGVEPRGQLHRTGEVQRRSHRRGWPLRRLLPRSGSYFSSDEWDDEIRRDARSRYPDDLAGRDAYFEQNRMRDDQRWEWSSSAERDRYQDKRGDALSARKRSEYMLGLAVANRLLAAVDAMRLVHKRGQGQTFGCP